MHCIHGYDISICVNHDSLTVLFSRPPLMSLSPTRPPATPQPQDRPLPLATLTPEVDRDMDLQATQDLQRDIHNDEMFAVFLFLTGFHYNVLHGESYQNVCLI